MIERWNAHESVWCWYVAVMLMIVAGWGRGVAGDGYAPDVFVAIHAGLLTVAIVAPWFAPPHARPWVRGVIVAIGLPTAFSSIGLILPWIHPEPFEWTWIELDRALFGTDPTVAVQAWLTPLVTEVLQWCYGSFYFVPIVAVVGAWKCGGTGGFDRALGAVQLGFLVSYVGYVIWPTLPPYRFLDHGAPLEGVWLFDHVHALLDGLEVNRWDCFPSGHTMMTVVSAVIAWRASRRLFWCLLPLVATIVFSTIALRYHYVVDVIAGLMLVWPTVWLADRLFGSVDPEKRPTGAAAEAFDACERAEG